MKRCIFMQAGLGSLTVLLMAGTAFSQQKKPLSLWYEAASPENQANLKTLLIKPFNEAHPNEQLKVDFRGSELDKQLRIALLSGSGPDIVYTPGPSYVAGDGACRASF